MRNGARVGLFGGTFDPPHIGHLVVAVNVAHELDLDVVLFMVANVPWQKVGERPISAVEQRLQMVELAASATPVAQASTLEIERGGDSYTADTLEELNEKNPSDQHFLILGSDVAAALETWKRPEVIARLATTVVVDRPGALGVALPERFACERVACPLVDLSSTELRERVADGRPIDFLTVPEVVDHVLSNDLYVSNE